MDRFFCALLLCALLLCAGAAGGQGRVQGAFFSMLFPQLMPGIEEITTPAEAQPGEAVFL